MANAAILIVVIPVFTAVVITLLDFTRGRTFSGHLAIGSLGAALGCALALVPQILRGESIIYTLGSWDQSIGISLLVDRLPLFLALLGNLLGGLVLLYSLAEGTYHPKFYALLLLMMGGISGAFLSGDLFNLFVFMEVLSLSSYILVAHYGHKASLLAGMNYLLISGTGFAFFLFGIGIVYRYTGALNMINMDAEISRFFSQSPRAAILPLALFIVGTGVKCAMVPLHTWLPNAHSMAPSPVSALLSGIVIKVGIYALFRLVQLFRSTPLIRDTYTLLVYTGTVTMVIGVSLALLQKDLKKLLAYHSVSQIGYILLGIGSGGYGLAGGLFHIFSHAIFKGLLFLTVGAVIFRTGIRKIDLLGGVWRKMPVTTFTCIIAAFSISGVPLTSGYASKGIIFEGIKGNLALEIIFILTSAGTCASFLKLVRHTFFGQPNSPLAEVKEVSGSMYIPMIFLSLGSLMLGIFPASVLKVLVGPFAPEPHLWTLPHIAEALLSLGIGFALYSFLLRIGVFGFNHHEETRLEAVNPKIPGRGHILRYFSIDRLYNYIARGIFVLCAKLEKIHHRSLGVYIQMVISFLIIIIFMYLMLLEK